MFNAKTLNIIGLVLNIAFSCLFILTLTALIQERSVDIVRVTVTDAEVLRTAQELQAITGKYAYAYPVKGSDETLWRVVVDRRSRTMNAHW